MVQTMVSRLQYAARDLPAVLDHSTEDEIRDSLNEIIGCASAIAEQLEIEL